MTLVYFLPGELMLLVVALYAILAVPRRVGDAEYCGKCEHAKIPSDDEAEHCPNCGVAWTAPGGVVKGRLVTSPWATPFGVLAVVLMFVGFACTVFGGLKMPLHILPTSTLLHEVTQGGVDDCGKVNMISDAWAVLQTRELSDGQLLGLAEDLLAAPFVYETRDGSLAWWGRQSWLAELVESGRLPSDFVERYWRLQYDFELHIVSPERVALGEEFTVGVGVDWQWKPPSPWSGVIDRPAWAWFYCSGFFVGDSDEPLGRQEEILGYWEKRRRLDEYREKRGKFPAVTLKADRLGPLRVRFVAWVAVSKQWLWSEPITWQDDGMPGMPKDAIWTERVEAECVIEVVESVP
ncbi:MAG: hypothetical protein KAY37_08255 [Phycisphaerae bacterium]|nr:hypothetical protein [Phycisphaerae bacterium]